MAAIQSALAHSAPWTSVPQKTSRKCRYSVLHVVASMYTMLATSRCSSLHGIFFATIERWLLLDSCEEAGFLQDEVRRRLTNK